MRDWFQGKDSFYFNQVSSCPLINRLLPKVLTTTSIFYVTRLIFRFHPEGKWTSGRRIEDLDFVTRLNNERRFSFYSCSFWYFPSWYRKTNVLVYPKDLKTVLVRWQSDYIRRPWNNSITSNPKEKTKRLCKLRNQITITKHHKQYYEWCIHRPDNLFYTGAEL